MKKILIVIIVVMTLASCSKKTGEILQPQPKPETQAPNSPDDARKVLLKEVIAEALPSPYYYFTYDSLHYVKQIDFASGFSVYNVAYENRRVKLMTNIRNNHTMIYSYKDGRVSEIVEFSAGTKRKIKSYRFFYNAKSQLVQVLWISFAKNADGDLFKKIILTYHPDGNLASMARYNSQVDLTILSSKTLFSDYDDNANVADFFLLEDFFDSFLFLPQVKLQKNNPLREQIISEQSEYDIHYTYQFENSLPVRKTGNVLLRKGTDAGKSVQIYSRFTYY